MRITENFTLEELIHSTTALSRGINNIPTAETAKKLEELCQKILQPIRNRINEPITVTSGYRSKALNSVVGGAKNSQHMYGEAADIKCKDNKKLWKIICEMISKGEITVGQLIDEKGLRWIHISLPTEKHKNHIFSIK